MTIDGEFNEKIYTKKELIALVRSKRKLFGTIFHTKDDYMFVELKKEDFLFRIRNFENQEVRKMKLSVTDTEIFVG